MKTADKNIHWIVLLLIAATLTIKVYILLSILHLGLTNTLSAAFTSTAIFCLTAWGVVLIMRTYPTTVAIILRAFIISTVLSIIATLADWQLLRWLTHNSDSHFSWYGHGLLLLFTIIWLVNSWIATYVAQRKKTETLENKFRQQSDASVFLREAELFKLRQQLQPHFLYNSLNSINALIMIEPAKAQEMLGKLSDFLRSSVKREAEDMVPIEDELVYIQSYLAIESIRFGDRLQVNFEKEYTDDATIPPFLLQPILENAIKFGLYGKTGNVSIYMHIVLESQMLTITITNPYDPQTTPPKGTGFGLEGIQRRLYLLYARTDLLETSKDEEIFTTILKIPQSHV